MAKFSADIMSGQEVLVADAWVRLFRTGSKWRGHFLFPISMNIAKGQRFTIRYEGSCRVVKVCEVFPAAGSHSAVFEEEGAYF
jgi:cephalosporin hydroxylase